MRVSGQERAHARPANAQPSTGYAHQYVRLDSALRRQGIVRQPAPHHWCGRSTAHRPPHRRRPWRRQRRGHDVAVPDVTTRSQKM